MTPEFSRTVRIDTLGSAPKALSIEADEAERAALAERFDLIAIDGLSAEMTLARNGEVVIARGLLRAGVAQACVVTGDPVAADVDERFAIVFQPQPSGGPDEEIELSEEEMDVVFYDGAQIDVGEAVAETLSLALDPYPRSPSAEAVLREAGVMGEEQAEKEEAEARTSRSPFAALRKP